MTLTLGLLTDSVAHLPFGQALDLAAECGLTGIELATGAWSTAPHIRLDELLDSEPARKKLLGEVTDRGLALTALTCSGNPLHPGPTGPAHDEITRKTLRLAGLLDVSRVVMMSGLPGGPGDANPNWITVSWPPETTEMLDWQWTERVVPYWQTLTDYSKSVTDARICLEMHAQQSVHSVPTFLHLRERLNGQVYANLDPSHLIWMGADPIAAARALGDAIGHIHAKDARIETTQAALTGRQETLPPSEVRDRSWNYTTLGYGQGIDFWRSFFLELSRVGYSGAVNIEHEDYSMGREEGVRKAAKLLRSVVIAGSSDYQVQEIAGG